MLWGGWLVVTGAGLQLHERASSTPTTRSRWRRRSARWSASAARLPAGAARTVVGQRARARHRGDRRRSSWRAARPHAGLASVAALRRRRPRRRRRSCCARPRLTDRAAGRRGPCGARWRARARPRSRGLQPRYRGHAARGSTPASGPAADAGGGPGRMLGGAPGSRAARPRRGGRARRPGDAGGPVAAGRARRRRQRGGSPAGFGGAAGRRRHGECRVIKLLQQDSGLHTWAAATVGTNSAAPLQLASGQSVMAIGGFNGGDPAPTLEQFQELVADGQIHWFVAGGRGGAGGGPGGGGGTGSEIQSWVAANFTAQTVGGTDRLRPDAGASPAPTTASDHVLLSGQRHRLGSVGVAVAAERPWTRRRTCRAGARACARRVQDRRAGPAMLIAATTSPP